MVVAEAANRSYGVGLGSGVFAEQFDHLIDGGRRGQVGPRGALAVHERVGMGVDKAREDAAAVQVDHLSVAEGSCIGQRSDVSNPAIVDPDRLDGADVAFH